MLGIDWKVLRRPPKNQILAVVPQNCKKLALKYSMLKPRLPYFVDLSTRTYPRLYLQRNIQKPVKYLR